MTKTNKETETMTRNANNPNFFDFGTIVLGNGNEAAHYRTLCTAPSEVLAWDRGEGTDETNVFAIESFNYPGCYSYARVTPTARKETPVGGKPGNGYGYKVRVEFLIEGEPSTSIEAWVLSK